MHGNRRTLHHEPLESRRLLAADCQPIESSVAEGESVQPAIDRLTGLVNGFGGPANLSLNDASATFLGPVAPIGYFGLSHGSDLVQEVDDKLYVVDQAPFETEDGRLHVFQRGGDGALEPVTEVEVGFPVQRMIVQGDQVLLFGTDFQWSILATVRGSGTPTHSATTTPGPENDLSVLPEAPKTRALTVNLGDEVSVVRQEFEGLYHEIHHAEDRIVMVSSVGTDAVIAIYPPPLIAGLATTYAISPDGLNEVASTEVPLFGMTQVRGSDLYVARNVHSDIVYLAPVDRATETGIRAPDVPIPPTVTLTRYLLAETAIDQLDELELGPGFLLNFDVSADGNTGVIVRSELAGAGPATSIDLLDLSGDRMRVFDTVRLAEFNGNVLATSGDHIVLKSYNNESLVVIDTNQDIDVSAEGRVRRIEVPTSLTIHYESLLLAHDRLILRADRVVPATAEETTGRANRLSIADFTRQSVLLTVSISQAEIIADTNLSQEIGVPRSERLFLIDSETERFGLIVNSVTASGDVRAQFLFGRLNQDGEFQRDGSVALGRPLEVDANADRLIVRESDRLLEYDWQTPDAPVETRLGDPDSTIAAVDDHYTLHSDGQDHVLDVLSNDVVDRQPFFARAEIVQLVGAPRGSEILFGRMIRIPSEALVDVDQLRFEYVISNGREESRATVEIEINSINEEQIHQLLNAIQRRAAEDFDVPIDSVEITSVERFFDKPLPIVLPNDPVEFDFSPGILVTLTVPNATALYAANVEGEILQLFASRREYLVELGLRAVDDSGATLERVAEGDSFWLEFNAQDLRRLGTGVFAAFFDLVLPTEHLVVTGPVEYGPGFTSIRVGGFEEGEIDDLGAIGRDTERPGNTRQQILRIGVRAVGTGEITLKPEAADAVGTETLIHGRPNEVPTTRVRYVPLQLSIVAPDGLDPLDTDGNGVVGASDALLVINFLGRYGTTSLERLAETVRGGAEGEMTDDQLAAMRRLDTNGNGTIAAIDALLVINRMGRDQAIGVAAEGEKDDEPIEDGRISVDGLESGKLF